MDKLIHQKVVSFKDLNKLKHFGLQLNYKAKNGEEDQNE